MSPTNSQKLKTAVTQESFRSSRLQAVKLSITHSGCGWKERYHLAPPWVPAKIALPAV